MTSETIVAVYRTSDHASRAVQDLEAAGISPSAISQHASGGPSVGSTGAATPAREKGFWASLFGGEPEHDTSVYDRSLESGSTVVTVKAPELQATQVVDILERHQPIDMDEQAASYGTTTANSTTTTTTTTTPLTGAVPAAAPAMRTGQNTTAQRGGEEVIPLAEERLTVGKRVVNRGTTRIRRFVAETPVEEAVTLRSEHVSVERRPVVAGAKVTEADFAERTIEATEMNEEAVVAKTARVKEEVVVKKVANERDETVRDTVRREEVEITRDGETSSTSGVAAPTPSSTRPRT